MYSHFQHGYPSAARLSNIVLLFQSQQPQLTWSPSLQFLPLLKTYAKNAVSKHAELWTEEPSHLFEKHPPCKPSVPAHLQDARAGWGVERVVLLSGVTRVLPVGSPQRGDASARASGPWAAVPAPPSRPCTVHEANEPCAGFILGGIRANRTKR